MIAADTSSIIAYFNGEDGPDTDAIETALRDDTLFIPPVVLAEALSDPKVTGVVVNILNELSVLELYEGYWLRVAGIRKTLLARGFKAKLGDALIAQSCIDHKVSLITRDKDFRHYAKHCGLKLYA